MNHLEARDGHLYRRLVLQRPAVLSARLRRLREELADVEREVSTHGPEPQLFDTRATMAVLLRQEIRIIERILRERGVEIP